MANFLQIKIELMKIDNKKNKNLTHPIIFK